MCREMFALLKGEQQPLVCDGRTASSESGLVRVPRRVSVRPLSRCSCGKAPVLPCALRRFARSTRRLNSRELAKSNASLRRPAFGPHPRC